MKWKLKLYIPLGCSTGKAGEANVLGSSIHTATCPNGQKAATQTPPYSARALEAKLSDGK